MAEGIRLSAAVIYVRHLDRSVHFYRKLFGLTVADSSTTAALLTNGDDSQLVLRAVGDNATHALGSVGIQFLAWTVATTDQLENMAGILRRNSAYRETRKDDQAGATVVEGRDPDDIVIMLVHSDQSRSAMRRLPVRIYAW